MVRNDAADLAPIVGANLRNDIKAGSAVGKAGRTERSALAFLFVGINLLIDVIYTNQQTLSVRHAQWSGTAWRFETIDGAGNLTAGGTTDQVGFPTFLGAVDTQIATEAPACRKSAAVARPSEMGPKVAKRPPVPYTGR